MVALFFLTSYLYMRVVTASCPAGTTAYDPDVNVRRGPEEGRVYLNLNEVATCNGSVYGWRYCFGLKNDGQQQLIIAMYRPQQNGTYKLVPGSYNQLNEGVVDSFACRNITLQSSERFTVQENDVVAFCEEVGASHIEVFFEQDGDSLKYWDAGGCSELSISFTGIPSEQENHVFLLSALIDPEVAQVQSSDDDTLGKGIIAGIVIAALTVVVAVSAIIVVICCKKKQNLTLSPLMIVVAVLLTLLQVALIFITHPRTAFKKTRRDNPPVCLEDTTLGSHKYVTANGIKFHYVSSGDASKPLMLLLHGFPEFWFSWRHQLRKFSKDYHVVAIDMRGYGDSDKPPAKRDYSIELLIQDFAELIPALGYSSCILGAHDWGGIVAWCVSLKYPDLVDRLIIMNSPHLKVFERYIQGNCGQFFKSWYMFLFQVPKLPEFLYSLRDYSLLDDIFTGPNWGVKDKISLPFDVVEAYKYAFSQPGALTGPINYYRCFSQIREAVKPFIDRKIDVPTQIIWGDGDAFLSSAMADLHKSVCTDLTVKHIPNCSHWVQQDATELCNQYMSDFLSSRDD